MAKIAIGTEADLDNHVEGRGLRSRDLEPTLNPVNIRLVQRPVAFSSCGDAVIFSPCCSWLLFPKGHIVRPFECQTAPRRILDVSVPYALLSFEVDGRTGRWFIHPFISSLHVLPVCEIRTTLISQLPLWGPRKLLWVTSVDHSTKNLTYRNIRRT